MTLQFLFIFLLFAQAICQCNSVPSATIEDYETSGENTTEYDEYGEKYDEDNGSDSKRKRYTENGEDTESEENDDKSKESGDKRREIDDESEDKHCEESEENTSDESDDTSEENCDERKRTCIRSDESEETRHNDK
uniref:Uncharacterized protein n=1 Tax=Strigamia maritima TaxID=126957 RepID=T1J321_STRMM